RTSFSSREVGSERRSTRRREPRPANRGTVALCFINSANQGRVCLFAPRQIAKKKAHHYLKVENRRETGRITPTFRKLEAPIGKCGCLLVIASVMGGEACDVHQRREL